MNYLNILSPPLDILPAASDRKLCRNVFEPFPKRQILDSSELKEFADETFKFSKYDRELAKRVDNTVGKGEIAQYEQFLLLPQHFQKISSALLID